MFIAMPANANAIKKTLRLNACNATICAVIVVPMFAPMMIVAACFKDIMPVFTNPITITVVMAELCTTAVAAAPKPTPTSFLSDVLLNSLFSPLPASFSILSESNLNPSRNTPQPARMVITE